MLSFDYEHDETDPNNKIRFQTKDYIIVRRDGTVRNRFDRGRLMIWKEAVFSSSLVAIVVDPTKEDTNNQSTSIRRENMDILNVFYVH